HPAGIGREAQGRVHVADLADDVANHAVDAGWSKVRATGDFARHHDKVGGHQRFTGHPALRVGLQAVVKDGVADLISHLVRMAHRDRFACKQVTARGHGKTLAARKTRKSPVSPVAVDYRRSTYSLAIASVPSAREP